MLLVEPEDFGRCAKGSEVDSTTAGSCSSMRFSSSSMGMLAATSSRFGSSETSTLRPTATRSSNFPEITEGIRAAVYAA
jgi:hypothetical protein